MTLKLTNGTFNNSEINSAHFNSTIDDMLDTVHVELDNLAPVEFKKTNEFAADNALKNIHKIIPVLIDGHPEMWPGYTYAGDYSDTQLKDICWSEPLKMFCAIGTVGSPEIEVIMTSSDGEEWTSRPLIRNPSPYLTYHPSKVIWNDEHGMFVIAVSIINNDPISSPTMMPGGLIITSTDGTTWSRIMGIPQITDNLMATVMDLKYISHSGLFVVTWFTATEDGEATNSYILTSPDAITWTITQSNVAYSNITYNTNWGKYICTGTDVSKMGPGFLDTTPWCIYSGVNLFNLVPYVNYAEHNIFVDYNIYFDSNNGKLFYDSVSKNTYFYYGGNVYITDGLSISSCASGIRSDRFNIGWSPELKIGYSLSRGDSYSLQLSRDMKWWVDKYIPLTPGMSESTNTYNGMCYSPYLGKFCIIGSEPNGNTLYILSDPVTIPVEGVRLNTNYITTNTKLRVSIIPENATNKNVTWTSADETKAIVTNSGDVTLIEDTTSIYAETEDGHYVASCTTNYVSISGISFINLDNPIEMTVGDAVQFDISINSGDVSFPNDILWTSSNREMVTVNRLGIVTAVSPTGSENLPTITVVSSGDPNIYDTKEIYISD